MKVRWSDVALRDVSRIHDYLYDLNPVAARRIAETLLVAGDSLPTFPRRGRPGSAPGTRELAAVPPYLLIYKADEAEVVIVGVFHAAQDR